MEQEPIPKHAQVRPAETHGLLLIGEPISTLTEEQVRMIGQAVLSLGITVVPIHQALRPREATGVAEEAEASPLPMTKTRFRKFAADYPSISLVTDLLVLLGTASGLPQTRRQTRTAGEHPHMRPYERLQVLSRQIHKRQGQIR